MKKLGEKVRCPLKGDSIQTNRKNIKRYINKFIKAITLNRLIGITFLVIALIFTLIISFKTTYKQENIETQLDTKIESTVVTDDFTAAYESKPEKTYEEIALEIIKGTYSTGAARTEQLTALGYSTEEISKIQEIVNTKLAAEKVIVRVPNSATSINNSTNEMIPIEAVAQKVWDCMKSYGWNDIICAGIMGNMMSEVGGQTFNLVYNSAGCGYGLCQWTSGRRNLLLSIYGNNPTIEQQIEYIYKELTGIGIKRQVTQTGYNAIMNATSPEECAVAFAKYFERCGASYKIRQINARKAYTSFVG